MLRLALKYPYHGLNPFQRYETSRLWLTSYHYSQKSCPGPASTQSRKDGGGKSGRRGGTGFFYTFGLITVATGATLAYAKYDPEFRKWLGTQAPWTESVISFVFQEKQSIGEAFTNTVKKIEEGLHSSIAGIKGTPKREEESKETFANCIEEKKKSKPEYTAPRSVFSSILTQTPPEPEKTWSEVRVLPEPMDGNQPNPEIVSSDREPPEDVSYLPADHPLSLAELEKSIQESATIAINAYQEAACAATEASADVLKLIDQSVHHRDDKALSKIKGKFEKKAGLINEAETRAQNAKENICTLKDLLESTNIDVQRKLREHALLNAERVLAEINIAQAELEIAKAESGVTEEYAKKVEAARKHYIDEMLILFPDMRPSDREWHVNKHDLDLFVYYCFQNVLFYQKELAKAETVGSSRIRAALGSGDEKGDRSVVNAAVAGALDAQARELELDFQKRLLEIKQSTEKAMRQQLKRQAEVHSDHLTDVVAIREKEMERKFQREEDEKLSKEQNKFKHQLSGLVGRLQGLESALKARSQIDKGAHQAQVLWSACQALDSALKHSEPGIPWDKQLHPLEIQLNAVRKAALEDDELVNAVLDGIPEEAKRRGVFPEGALRERFLQVEKSARSVALVPYEGASLPIYFLSYLQSSFLIKTLNPIPQSELENEPSNIDELDTYDILQRSRYWMERGNIEQALRYMNLLSGASRAVARDWIQEARIYLETKQAATVLMTHASAAGLLYI